MKLIIPMVALLSLFGCTGLPAGVRPVENFQVDRYLGTWYEIARLDHRFERGLSRVSATYSQRDDGGIAVVNRGYDAATNSWKETTGRAYFLEGDNIGRLKVTFFWPFYGGYNIMELDQDDYQYSLVCGPDFNYLWILARQKKLDPKVFDRLKSTAEKVGFSTENLIMVEHE